MEAISYEVAENGVMDIEVTGFRHRFITCLNSRFVNWYIDKRGITEHADEIPYMLSSGEIYMSTMTLFVNDIIK